MEFAKRGNPLGEWMRRWFESTQLRPKFGEVYWWRVVGSGKILLISDVLIGGDKKVEFRFCESKEFAVTDSTPTTLLRGLASVPGQERVHWPRNAFVE
jgi:hypothetical protein